MVPSSNSNGKNRQWAVRAKRAILGDGKTSIDGAVMLIRGSGLAAIGSERDLKLTPGTEVVDLGDETLLPGFIDTHNHPSLKPIGTVASDYIPSQFYDPPARITARALHNMRLDLMCGVTTLRCVGELNFIDVILAEDVRNCLITGPNVIPSGPRLGPTGGHVWIPEWSVDGPENIRQVIKGYVGQGSKLIKIGLLDESPEKTSYSEQELRAVTDESHSLGVPVAAHCTGAWGSSIRACLKTEVDVIEHVTPLNEQIIADVARTKTSFSLTPFVYKLGWPQGQDYWEVQDFKAKSAKEWMDFNAEAGNAYLEANPKILTEDRFFGREVFPALKPWMKAVKQAWQAGIPMSVGSDCPHGIFPLNMEFLAECGIPALHAISAGTGMAARVSGVLDFTGTLEPGKQADFVSVRGNPLEDITTLRDIHLVVRSGIRYDHLSLQ